MATGQEMAVKAALNMVFKMFGIDQASTQADIVAATKAVLTFDVRLADIERNQMRMMQHFNIEPEQNNGRSENIGRDGNGAGGGRDECHAIGGN